MNKILNRVVIASPSGNDTALVFDKIDRTEQGPLSKLIQKNYPSTEQVMYVEHHGDKPFGQMAGGEFCGNAARSLAFVLAQDGVIEKNKDVMLNVSGSTVSLKTHVNQSESRSQMPINSKSLKISNPEESVNLVELEGISFVVLEEGSSKFEKLKQMKTLETKKSYVIDIIKEYNFDNRLASGVLSLERSNNKFFMDPYVYVRDTETLYYETACGSGTTAIGLLEAQRNGKSIEDYEIYQPSGKPIKVSVEYTNGLFSYAHINGTVDIKFDGAMPLNFEGNTNPQKDKPKMA